MTGIRLSACRNLPASLPSVVRRILLALSLLVLVWPRSEAETAPMSAELQALAEAVDLPSVTTGADPAVDRMQAVLEEYLKMAAAGGWPLVPPGPKLKRGVSSERVAILRRRLIASGDLEATSDAAKSADADMFDTYLDAALRRFQARHGLVVDGIVGPETLGSLNIPIGSRIASIRLNLSRLAQQPHEPGARYIEVNVPAAAYRYVEGGHVVLAGPVIVGKPKSPTPQLDSIIHHIEFHPPWTVPTSIASHEIWPKVRRDDGYLRRHHMRVIDGIIRQDPGPDNPLGIVKFIFDNPHGVYLHDTNDHQLFERSKRFLSHGCVRVSNALQLATKLLESRQDWPEARIEDILKSGRTTRIQLGTPIPLYIIYRTMWVDDANVVQFRTDVYGLDKRQLGASQAASVATTSDCGQVGR